MANELQNEVFHNEAKARKWLEKHLWCDGRVCGYCGTIDNSTPLTGREGYYQCNETDCRTRRNQPGHRKVGQADPIAGRRKRCSEPHPQRRQHE